MRLSVGVHYDLPPIALVEDDTTWVPAGAVVFGLEQRLLDEAAVSRSFSESQRAESAIEGVKTGNVKDDGGPSVHVCDAETRRELLRFDCFRDEPHYHYLPIEGGNIAVAFDEHAHGDMVQFTLRCLRQRLAPMLAHTGAAELALRLDEATLDAAVGRLAVLLHTTFD